MDGTLLDSGEAWNDHAETLEDAIRWCIQRNAHVYFFDNEVDINIAAFNRIVVVNARTFLDAVHDLKSKLAQIGTEEAGWE